MEMKTVNIKRKGENCIYYEGEQYMTWKYYRAWNLDIISI